MLARSEVVLNLFAESGTRRVRHRTTAFLTFVGGRAFQEAVPICGYSVELSFGRIWRPRQGGFEGGRLLPAMWSQMGNLVHTNTTKDHGQSWLRRMRGFTERSFCSAHIRSAHVQTFEPAERRNTRSNLAHLDLAPDQ